MPYTITYLNRSDFYKTKKDINIKKLSIDNFLINVNTIGNSDSVVFIDNDNTVKVLK